MKYQYKYPQAARATETAGIASFLARCLAAQKPGGLLSPEKG
jgi:hypothetical protein